MTLLCSRITNAYRGAGVSDSSISEIQPARFGSFFVGLVFAFALFVFSSLFFARTADWRKCAPAETGYELASAVQYEDRTECFYNAIDFNRRGLRKM